MQLQADFVLASASPRRADLLRQIGCRFHVAPVDLDESILPGELAAEYVQRIALQKARAGWFASPLSNVPVLGADTTVVAGPDIFGKPADREQALSMLHRLSGTTHRVLSAVAMVAGERQLLRCAETQVTFRPLSVAECERYWQTGEPADKAGGYAIQGLGGVFVTGIQGSYSSVVGLPLAETCQLLQAFDIAWWRET
ncbi:Maf family protein [uncultured Porticoccus sp.]|uniref:Maf family protein n=1 Tax=uncultured Porticoccus sp. TaxID=1256050 RepID=UPI0026282A39|nr:Maf family protein [uncultured Porticoccus sp.]